MSLPPNWSRYNTDDGQEYFHNSVTNTTTWDRPVDSPSASGMHLETAAADVFTYQPTAQELDAPARVPQPAVTSTLSFDNELVSLKEAPGGKITQASPTEARGGGAAASGGDAAGAGGDAADRASGLANWALTQAQQVFDVSTEDIVQRLRLVMVPYPEPDVRAKEEFKQRPDFYGPFWIATTAVLFLAATGNFARLLASGDHSLPAAGTNATFAQPQPHWKADYSLVSLASGMIYGSLIAVPLLARAAVFVSGESGTPVDFLHLICVCGYSLAPVIPVSLLCIIPLGFLRWLLALAGLAVSLLFLKNNLLQDLQIETPWLKYAMMAGPCALPVSVFLVYRLHFF